MHLAAALIALVSIGQELVDALQPEDPALLLVNDTDRTQALLLENDDSDDSSDDAAPVCHWQMGLSCDLEDVASNLKLGEAGKCELPVPDPLETYADDFQHYKRKCITKKVSYQQPYVQLRSTKKGTTTTTSTRQTSWSQYVANPAAVQSEIKFDKPGMYDLEIVGDAYNHEVTCTGCVAILDNFRPRFGANGSCPLTGAVATPQTLTKAALTAFQGYDNAFRTYTADVNVVNNPSSGVLCGAAGTDKFSKFKFFYEAEKDCSSTCFDDTALASNVAKLKSTPLITANLQTSYGMLETGLNAQCKWCCRKTRRLKEMFTPYQCPTDYESDLESPTASCESGTGIPNTCSIDVCLKATGTDVATASATIKSTIQTASTAVLNALPSRPAGSDAAKHVYYSIPCTTFDRTNTDCRYSAKLSQLLDVTTGFVTTFPAPAAELTKSKDYVFWRYNTDGTTFVKWDPLADTAIAFTDPSTTVILEAWTACGRAYSTSFTVNLFVHSTLTCARFDAMWQVQEKPGVQGSEGTYCAYGGSDFAVLKMDLAVADVLPSVDSTVTGTYTGVKCDIMVKETGGTSTQVVSIVDDQTSTTLSKYFGVELVNNPTTAQKTSGIVHCKFTRTPRTNALALASATTASTTDTNSIDCSHTFTLTDCDKPEMNFGRKEDVCADSCAGDSAPGMFEACGGSVVTSSATNTILKPSTTQPCCTKCTQAMTCRAVGTTDLKRCEPPSVGLLLAETVALASEEEAGTSSEWMMTLLGASAMVAVVALVVVKRRADVARRASVEGGAYYLLLE